MFEVIRQDRKPERVGIDQPHLFEARPCLMRGLQVGDIGEVGDLIETLRDRLAQRAAGGAENEQQQDDRGGDRHAALACGWNGRGLGQGAHAPPLDGERLTAALAVDHWKGFMSIRWLHYSCLPPVISPQIIATTTHPITIPVRCPPSGMSANRAHAAPKLIQPMICALRFTALRSRCCFRRFRRVGRRAAISIENCTTRSLC